MLALKALTGSTGTWFGDSVPDGSPPPTTDGWIDQHRVSWWDWAPLSGVWYVARVTWMGGSHRRRHQGLSLVRSIFANESHGLFFWRGLPQEVLGENGILCDRGAGANHRGTGKHRQCPRIDPLGNVYTPRPFGLSAFFCPVLGRLDIRAVVAESLVGSNVVLRVARTDLPDAPMPRLARPSQRRGTIQSPCTLGSAVRVP